MGAGSVAAARPFRQDAAWSTPVPAPATPQGDVERVNRYESSLNMRVDIEAALTYLLLAVTGALARVARRLASAPPSCPRR